MLTALRWFPVGLLIPVTVLLPLDRGLGLAEVGTAYAVQGFVVLALELPTGGLADSLGRRPVLLVSTVAATLSCGVLLVADSFAWLVAFAALQGLHRALDSGPLEAWFVDGLPNDAPATALPSGLAAQGTVLGLSIASAAALSGGVIALVPAPEPLVVPVLAALAVQLTAVLAVAVLMTEARPVQRPSALASVRETPRVVVDGVRLLRHSPDLLALLSVELFWGFGMVTVENLVPVRLAEVGGGAEAAAALTGPAASGHGSRRPWGRRWPGWLPRGSARRRPRPRCESCRARASCCSASWAA